MTQETDDLPEQPQPGQKWWTESGSLVLIRPSADPAVIQAEYLDVKCGGVIEVQYGHDGRKLKGWPDRLAKRAVLY